jgi:hypothetical protein
MTKRSSAVFLPQVIAAWGGIDCWLGGDREGARRDPKRYPLFYDGSRPATICGWILKRLSRSGRVTVKAANVLLYRAAVRYSGAPERTYAAMKIAGYGWLVLNKNGNPAASVPIWSTLHAVDAATEEAQARRLAHSDVQTRMLWRAGGDRYEELKACRWCGEPVQFKEQWKEADGSVRCNRRDCRRMDYLRHTPQSKGGIDLTPRQRQGLSYEAWNTQRTINYLALVAKEQKRGRKSNHDVR